MKAELILTPNSDLKVVNAARVSFSKESSQFTYRKDVEKGSDEGLLHYLASHNHWTPFSHVRETFKLEYFDFELADYTDIAGMTWGGGFYRHSLWGWANLIRNNLLSHFDTKLIKTILSEKYPESMKAMGFFVERNEKLRNFDSDKHVEVNHPDFIDVTMRETIPIVIARQRFKHMVGFTYNEVSKRYVDDTPELYWPDKWRSRPEGSVKQGSGSKDIERPYAVSKAYGDVMNISKHRYGLLLEENVAPEQARMLLPQAMYTSYYVTAPLSAWARAYQQRIDNHAQKEIRDLAEQWDEILTANFGEVWERLK